jgi:DNA primase
MQAAAGSRRQLLPHPAAEQAGKVILVEGEPDMIAGRSYSLPAIALPGVDSWQDQWAALLAGRQVAIVMDCDRQGRLVAQRIADQLARCAAVRIIDLAPDRRDGYDLTAWMLDGAPDADGLGLVDVFSPDSDRGR